MKKINGLDRILLVDDDEATNFIHAMTIRRSNIDVEVQIVSNGREALDYLTCNGRFSDMISFPKPDIIILDLNMPGMNGWDFMEEYKRLPETQQAKVLRAMLSTGLNHTDQQRARDLNLGFLNKPLTLQNIEDIVCRNFSDEGKYVPVNF